MKAQQRPHDDRRVALQARDVSWDWSGLPPHYVDGDPVATHIVNGVHMLLPEGEVYFVSVFGQALALVQDDAVREDVVGFIGQEATHSSAHQSVLDHLQAEGLNLQPFVDQLRWLFRRVLGDRELCGEEARAWLVERVATVAAAEHFTSYLGNWGLNASAWDNSFEPRVLDLLRWHLAEEVEHRHVAYDLYTHLDGGYLRRVRAWALVWPFMLMALIRGTRYLLSVDPELPAHKRRLRLRDVRAAWRRGLIPTPWSLLRMTFEYFRPGYHPRKYGSTSQAVAYLAASPAARAAGH